MQIDLVSGTAFQASGQGKQIPYFTQQNKEKASHGNSLCKEEIKNDTILDPTIKNKTKAKINTIKSLPSYIERGINGDPNANFYEFMQISRIPYFLGGPGLVATILAGKNLFDIKANKAAGFNAKGMALGCALYYIMSAVAKKCVDIPVKVFRGVDLNHPYIDVVSNKTEDSSGKCKQRFEQHNVFESSKFIRWDLLYNKHSKDPREINSNYNKIAEKMGMPEDVNDSDSTVRPLIMSLIKQSRAWKYIIGAFAVMLGVGLGNQQAMKEEFCTGSLRNLKQNMTNLPESIKKLKPSNFKNILASANTKIIRPVKNSFISLWKGTKWSTSSKITGKIAIIGFLGSILAANVSIMKSTNKKGGIFVNKKEANV